MNSRQRRVFVSCRGFDHCAETCTEETALALGLRMHATRNGGGKWKIIRAASIFSDNQYYTGEAYKFDKYSCKKLMYDRKAD